METETKVKKENNLAHSIITEKIEVRRNEITEDHVIYEIDRQFMTQTEHMNYVIKYARDNKELDELIEETDDYEAESSNSDSNPEDENDNTEANDEDGGANTQNDEATTNTDILQPTVNNKHLRNFLKHRTGKATRTYIQKLPKAEKIVANEIMENIIECEDSIAKKRRYEADQISAEEYINMGNIAFEDKKLKKRFLRSGKIPQEITSEAMKVIDITVTMNVADSLLRQAKFRHKGKLKHGYEIWNILKIPSINPIETLLYHQKTLIEFQGAKTNNPYEYIAKFMELQDKRDEAYEALNGTATKEEMLAMVTTLTKFKTDDTVQATTKQALLQCDWKQLTIDQFMEKILKQIGTKLSRPKSMFSVNATTSGVTCFACGGNHPLYKCTDVEAKKALKVRNQDLYEKFINPRKPQAQDESKEYCMMTSEQDTKRTKIWLLDTGSTVNVTNDSTQLTNVDTTQGKYISTQTGNKKLTTTGDVNNFITDVLYNPEGNCSILSMKKVLEKKRGHGILFTGHAAYIIEPKTIKKIEHKGKLATNKNGLFEVSEEYTTTQSETEQVHNIQIMEDENIWHKRLGHANINKLNTLKEMGYINNIGNKMKDCHACGSNEYHRGHSKHPRKTNLIRNAKRPEKQGELHGDIAILSNKSEYKIAVIFVDAKSRYAHMFVEEYAKPKSKDMINWMQQLISAYNAAGETIRIIRFDGEPAVTSKKTQRFLRRHGIVHQQNTASEGNLAEMRIKTIRRTANKMLFEKGLEKYPFFEPFAWKYACTIGNLLPHETLFGRTPFQEHFCTSPYRQISRVKVFGSICYYKDEVTMKHDPAHICIYLGFDAVRSANYIVFDTTTRTKRLRKIHEAKFVETNHVDLPPNINPYEMFHTISAPDEWTEFINKSTDMEDIPNNNGTQDPATDDGDIQDPESEDIESMEDIENAPRNEDFDTMPVLINADSDSDSESDSEDEDEQYETANEDDQDKDENSHHTTPITTTRRSSRLTKKNVRFIEVCGNTTQKSHPTLIKPFYPKKNAIRIPKFKHELRHHPYKQEFLIAEKVELQTIMDAKTISFVDKPSKNVHRIPHRFTYDIKSDSNNNVERFKARLVVLGFHQKEGLEYEKSYAPVANWTTIQMIMALAAKNKLQMFLLDFKGAYLHAQRPNHLPVYLKDINNDILSTPPGKIPLLNKSLYGLIDAGYLWRLELFDLLYDLGFRVSINDPCLYTKQNGPYTTYTVTWVDDVLLASNDPGITMIKDTVRAKGFSVSTFDEIHNSKYLGLRVNYDHKKQFLQLDQRLYIDDILTTAKMTDCNPISTPMHNNTINKRHCPQQKLLDLATNEGEMSHEQVLQHREQINTEIKRMKTIPYRKVLGMLSHLTRHTRPDIAYATFYSARYQQDPGIEHWKGIKRILRYLKGNRNAAITFDITKPFFEVYCDSDYCGDHDNNKSTTGFVILMHGIPIMAKSRRQTINARSTTGAELLALAECVPNVIWLQNMLSELGFDYQPTIYVDNGPMVDIITNGKLSPATKHLMQRLYFVQDYYNNGHFKIKRIPTDVNIADIFTKPLLRQPFTRHRQSLLADITNQNED